jgi:hypothetical protein
MHPISRFLNASLAIYVFVINVLVFKKLTYALYVDLLLLYIVICTQFTYLYIALTD